jgi:hypothetical protein
LSSNAISRRFLCVEVYYSVLEEVPCCRSWGVYGRTLLPSQIAPPERLKSLCFFSNESATRSAALHSKSNSFQRQLNQALRICFGENCLRMNSSGLPVFARLTNPSKPLPSATTIMLAAIGLLLGIALSSSFALWLLGLRLSQGIIAWKFIRALYTDTERNLLTLWAGFNYLILLDGTKLLPLAPLGRRGVAVQSESSARSLGALFVKSSTGETERDGHPGGHKEVVAHRNPLNSLGVACVGLSELVGEGTAGTAGGVYVVRNKGSRE